MHRYRSVAGIVPLCLAAAITAAGATCGSANCFVVTGTQDGVGVKGAVTLDLSYRYIVQSRRLEGTESTGTVLTPKVNFEDRVLEPDHHREIRTRNTLVQLDLSWNATDRLTFATSLPLVNQRDHEHFDEAGTPAEFFTGDDGASGFGDVKLGARYGFLIRTKDLLIGGLGLKLPTGEYRLRDSEGGINEPTLQPGTGSTDLAASLYWAHHWLPSRFEGFVSAAHRVSGENDLDYRFGGESLLSAGLGYATGGKATWLLQANGRWTGRDRYLSERVSSTGATLINLTPGVRLIASTSAAFYTYLQIPVYQDVNDRQLAPRPGLLAGISKTF